MQFDIGMHDQASVKSTPYLKLEKNKHVRHQYNLIIFLDMPIKDVTLTVKHFSHLDPKEDESMALVHVEKQKGRYFIQKLLFSNYIKLRTKPTSSKMRFLQQQKQVTLIPPL